MTTKTTKTILSYYDIRACKSGVRLLLEIELQSLFIRSIDYTSGVFMLHCDVNVDFPINKINYIASTGMFTVLHNWRILYCYPAMVGLWLQYLMMSQIMSKLVPWENSILK